MANDVSLSGAGSVGSSFISGNNQITGLMSGMDFKGLVDSMVVKERRIIDSQTIWKGQWQAKIKSITALDERLVSLKQYSEDHEKRDQFIKRKSIISDSNVLSVTNTSEASLGSYSVEVGSAIKEKLNSRPYKTTDAVGGAPNSYIKIKLGQKTLQLQAGSWTAGANNNQYDPNGNLSDLMAAINEAAKNQGVDITASLIDDKKVGNDSYQRLILSAGVGGKENKIQILEDSSSLELDKNHIGNVVKSSWLFSNVEPKVASSSSYFGHVNKSFTFVIDNTGNLGTDDIVIKWADTDNNNGEFTIKADEWNENKEFEVFQGIKLTFDKGADNGTMARGEAFTIDCQAPVLQKAQDNGLAQTDKLVHKGFNDQISPLIQGRSGIFAYSYAGKIYSVTLRDGGSLGALVEAINSDPKNPGVEASVINDGLGSITSHRLVLTGNRTGADNAIRLVDPATLPGGEEGNRIDGYWKNTDFKWAREASNSMSKIDGFPETADDWLQRPTNDVADVIDGVVVTLSGVGSSTITVQTDVEKMMEEIKQFVDSVNFVKSYINEETKWGGTVFTSTMQNGTLVRNEEKPSGIMIGNYGFQISKSELDSVMTRSIVPFENDPTLSYEENMRRREAFITNNNLLYTSLNDIGIKSDPDNKGLYTIEPGKLREALTKNNEAVVKLFTGLGDDIKFNGSAIKGINALMAKKTFDLTNDKDIIGDQNSENPGEVVAKAKGITKTLLENYNKIIKDIDEKIAREEARINLYKQRMTDQFVRLEKTLTALQAQSKKFESLINNNSDKKK